MDPVSSQRKAFDDLIANKTMAIIEWHAPKDLVDLYLFMIKKRYTAKRILHLLEKKFGLQAPASLFWSQASLADRDLQEATFGFTTNKKEDQKLREDVHRFVVEKSYKFLRVYLH